MSDTPRRLFLHIGPAKTGTTAVQSVFRNLDDPRLTYPKSGQWPDGSHNLITIALEGLRQRGPQAIPDIETLMPVFLKELAEAPQDALVSSEGLCAPKIYRAFLEHLNAIPAFDEVIPLITLRHPVERLASVYNQEIKDAHYGQSQLPDEFLEARAQNFLMTPFVQRWSRIAEGAVFLSFHPTESFVTRFCETLGRPDLAPQDPGRPNRSLSGKGLALLLLGNRHLPDAPARAHFFNEVMRPKRELKLWTGPSFPFSPPAVERALASGIRDDLVEIRDTYGIDLTHQATPEAIALTEADMALVREVALEHLPADNDLDGDIDRVLQCFS